VPTTAPIQVRSPEIMQGIGNIVQNAVSFAHRQIRIATRWTTEWSEVEVSDDGPGFSESLLDELGTPFIPRAGCGRPYGAGRFHRQTLLERTGASVSSAIVATELGGPPLSCAGQIPSSRLHSAIEGVAMTQDTGANRPVSPVLVGTTSNKDRTLLIADDDAAFRNRIARALELRGFIVTSVGSVAEALAQTARPPAFAVLDLRLGDGNGLELVGPLRQARPDIRIVVLTGYATSRPRSRP